MFVFEVILVAIFLTILIVLDDNVARKFESIAFDKGYTRSAGVFWMCFLLGPVGYIYVAAMPVLTAEQIEAKRLNKRR